MTIDVIQLAKEAGMFTHKEVQPEIERFADLVATALQEEANRKANAGWALMCKKMVDAEREECAKVANEISNKYAFGYYGQEVDTADEIAEAIRARKPA